MSKVLHLTLKKKWFDMILKGEKKEEYREIKPYWERRIHCVYMESFHGKPYSSIYAKTETTTGMVIYSVGAKYDTIKFTNGYAKNAPSFEIECLGIETGKAKPEWSDNWQGEVFVIKLGKIITT